jgi:arylsulfatase A-like enzyme
MTMYKRSTVLSAGLLAAVLLFFNGRPAPVRHPNFLFILVDDMGWSSLSSPMDNEVADSKSSYLETPNIDRLGDAGMRFSQGYAPAALCTPSRRSIQFGQSPIHMGNDSVASDYNPHTHHWLTIPHMLKAVDPAYRTAHFGKWDLRADIYPEDLGYDESDGNTGNDNGDRMTDKKTKWTQVYVTKDPKRTVTITGRALNFMQRQVASGHPFYLQVSYYATHVDMETRKNTYQKFQDKKKGSILYPAGWAGMQNDMDRGVGRLLDQVQKLGIAANTYIILMADNGGVELFPPPSGRNKLDPPSAYSQKTYNYPLRGGKWVLYEGGIRVPFMMAGPGIPAHSYCHVPVVGYDLLPTIGYLAGHKGSFPSYLDGGNIAPLFRDPAHGTVTRARKDLYFHRYVRAYAHSAIREGDYKLIERWFDGKTELYDLRSDLGEVHDLSDSMPGRVKELKQKLNAYLTANHIDEPGLKKN